MAAIDFPNSPTNGQVFTSAGLSWTYQTGVGWLLNSGAVAGGGFTYTQEATPTTPTPFHGATWYNTATGISSIYVNDGNSVQWVQYAPGSGLTPIPGGGSTNQSLVKKSNGDYDVQWKDMAWNQPRGYVCSPAIVQANQGAIGTTATNLTGFIQTFTAEAGRLYECSWILGIVHESTGNAYIRANMDGALLLLTVHGTVSGGNLSVSSGSFQFVAGQSYGALPSLPSGANKSIILQGYSSAGSTIGITSASYMNGRMATKDIGPVTYI